jgi:hypothetical protein
VVLDDRIAEVIDHRCDREDAAEAFVEALVGHRSTSFVRPTWFGIEPARRSRGDRYAGSTRAVLDGNGR